MLTAEVDGDVLVAVETLTQTADEYLADHGTISGVMVQTAVFPGFASAKAFAGYLRVIADHYGWVRHIALATDSAVASIVQFVANHVAGLQMRHYAFSESATTLEWLRVRLGTWRRSDV